MTWRRITIERYTCSRCHQLVWSRWGNALTGENAWNGQLLHDKREGCRGQPVPCVSVTELDPSEIAPEKHTDKPKRNQT